MYFNKSLTSHWKYWCNISNIGGLHHIYGSRLREGLITRIVWITLFLIMLSLSGLSCLQCVQRYRSYNVKTSTTFDSMPKIEFPAITICNVNRYLRSVIGGNPYMLIGNNAGAIGLKIDVVAKLIVEVKILLKVFLWLVVLYCQ